MIVEFVPRAGDVKEGPPRWRLGLLPNSDWRPDWPLLHLSFDDGSDMAVPSGVGRSPMHGYEQVLTDVVASLCTPDRVPLLLILTPSERASRIQKRFGLVETPLRHERDCIRVLPGEGNVYMECIPFLHADVVDRARWVYCGRTACVVFRSAAESVTASVVASEPFADTRWQFDYGSLLGASWFNGSWLLYATGIAGGGSPHIIVRCRPECRPGLESRAAQLKSSRRGGASPSATS